MLIIHRELGKFDKKKCSNYDTVSSIFYRIRVYEYLY